MRHSIIICEDGLYAFGDNYCGQLGIGHSNNINVPTKINFFDNHQIISVSLGFEHTMEIFRYIY